MRIFESEIQIYPDIRYPNLKMLKDQNTIGSPSKYGLIFRCNDFFGVVVLLLLKIGVIIPIQGVPVQFPRTFETFKVNNYVPFTHPNTFLVCNFVSKKNPKIACF